MSHGAAGALYLNGTDVTEAVTGLNIDLGQSGTGSMLILVNLSLVFEASNPSLRAIPGGSAFCSAAPPGIPRDGKPENSPRSEQ